MLKHVFQLNSLKIKQVLFETFLKDKETDYILQLFFISPPLLPFLSPVYGNLVNYDNIVYHVSVEHTGCVIRVNILKNIYKTNLSG